MIGNRAPLLIQTAIALALAALSHAGQAEEIALEARGAIDAYAKSATVRGSTDLVPSPAGAGFRDTYQGAAATLRLAVRSDALTFGAQLRLAVDGAAGAEPQVDEAYAEVPLGERAFAFAGRRILVWGQSLGLNPADLFGDPLRENDVFRRSRARSLVNGADMVGADMLFDGGSTLTLLHAPAVDRRDGRRGDLALARLSGYAFDGALDYAIPAIGGDRPGAGLSLSAALGDASVLHLDGAFRTGREKRTVADVDPAGALRLDPPETGTIRPYATSGFGHTFGNGLSLNVEYTHDAGGYSRSEWNDIVAALDRVSPAAAALHGRTLGELNGTLAHHVLRRNYAFARIAHEDVFGSDLAAELTVLHGIDDGSGTVGLRLEHPLSDRIAVGLKADRGYGGTNAEFTLRPETGSVALYTGVTF